MFVVDLFNFFDVVASFVYEFAVDFGVGFNSEFL